jgi:methionyl-tRNA formyltransferase
MDSLKAMVYNPSLLEQVNYPPLLLKTPIRVLLVGQGGIATHILNALLKAPCCTVVGVFPWFEREKAANKRRFIAENEKPFYSLIKKSAVPVVQKCPSINSFQFEQVLSTLQPTCILVASWGEKIQPHLFGRPNLKVVNCHPSLLPKYRGPHPISAAIIGGESSTGITYHYVTEHFDAGPVLTQKTFPIYNIDTGQALQERCASVAATMIPELMLQLFKDAPGMPQCEEEHTTTPRYTWKDAEIDWSETPEQIDRTVRGHTPWLPCQSRLNRLWFIEIRHGQVEKRTRKDAKVNHPGEITGFNKALMELRIQTTDPERIYKVQTFRLVWRPLFLPLPKGLSWLIVTLFSGSLFRVGNRLS